MRETPGSRSRQVTSTRRHSGNRAIGHSGNRARRNGTWLWRCDTGVPAVLNTEGVVYSSPGLAEERVPTLGIVMVWNRTLKEFRKRKGVSAREQLLTQSLQDCPRRFARNPGFKNPGLSSESPKRRWRFSSGIRLPKCANWITGILPSFRPQRTSVSPASVVEQRSYPSTIPANCI